MQSHVRHTRRAQRVAGVVKNTLVRLGFTPSRLIPCLYFCGITGVRLVAHVDDVLGAWSCVKFDEFEEQVEMAKEQETTKRGGQNLK